MFAGFVAAEEGAAAARGGVYTLRGEAGNAVRSGRTNDLARREAEHFRDPVLRDSEFGVEHTTDVYAEQRGLEQMLHDLYEPPLDRIRPISASNPRYDEYMGAARDYLGGGR